MSHLFCISAYSFSFVLIRLLVLVTSHVLLFCFSGLFPAVLNLATMADITTNATCGTNGPEMFCKLVEHVPGQPVRNPQCQICNQQEHHPIEYAIDGTNRWWQSPSIMNGMEYHYVTVTLDLKQVFQVAYVIIKAANSPRPGNWILERSIDGVTFEPWQYYAITDTECLTRFNINPRTGPPSYTRDDEVICTSFYSKVHPITFFFFLRKNILGNIYLFLYYYSIKDISVGGMCICYGHAKACPLNPKFSCECEHNTCGESCDHCCPGYHQQPWMAGTFLTRHVCEKCNCNNKAEECYFNQTVADLSLSLDTHSQYRGGGVCIGCRDNTAGINCQSCVPGYYRPREVCGTDTDDPCVPCSCDPHGSISQTCVADESQASPGQCLRCRQGYDGVTCDSCAEGYYGDPNCWWDAELQECMPCRCSPYGSISQRCDTEGRCICRPGFMGRRCDLRRLGYERRETRRPIERVPLEAVQQRWGGTSRTTGGCPRGAYRPQTGVTHPEYDCFFCLVLFLEQNSKTVK
uniref:Laminin, alpha 2 n=1 Tax=Poecilia reticulata TaxID=8081 RepID=A0A3P9NZ11_POERE